VRGVVAGESRAADGVRLDLAGAATVTVSLMLAVYAIVEGNVRDELHPDPRAAGAAAALFALDSRHRGPCAIAFDAARLFRLRSVSTPRRGVLWSAAMLPWSSSPRSTCSSCSATAPCRSGWVPSANLIMGAFSLGLSAKIVTALRSVASLGRRLACWRLPAWRCSRACRCTVASFVDVLPGHAASGAGRGRVASILAAGRMAR